MGDIGNKVTASDIEFKISLVSGVRSVEVGTLKAGVVHVRVVGGNLIDLRELMRSIKSVGMRVVILHQDTPESSPTEAFL